MSHTEVTFEPLSIECNCPGGLGSDCQLYGLRIDWSAIQSDTVSASELSIDFACNEGLIGGGTNSGSYNLSLDCNHTGGLLSYYFGRSLFSDDYGIAFVFIDRIMATYICINGDAVSYVEKPFSFQGNGNREICGGATGNDSQTILTPTSAVGIVLRSRPLGCTDEASQSIGVTLDVDDQLAIEFGAGSCYCASGGTTITFYPDEGPPIVTSPEYKFMIIDGRLADGLILDPETGCVLGAKVTGGFPGTDKLTVQVTDTYSGETAQVECGYIIPGCTSAINTRYRNRFK